MGYLMVMSLLAYGSLGLGMLLYGIYGLLQWSPIFCVVVIMIVAGIIYYVSLDEKRRQDFNWPLLGVFIIAIISGYGMVSCIYEIYLRFPGAFWTAGIVLVAIIIAACIIDQRENQKAMASRHPR